MSNKITVYHDGPGAQVQREVSKSEIAELGKNWKVADDNQYQGYAVSELSQAAKADLVNEAYSPEEEEGVSVELELGSDNPEGTSFEINPSMERDSMLESIFTDEELEELQKAEELENPSSKEEEESHLSYKEQKARDRQRWYDRLDEAGYREQKFEEQLQEAKRNRDWLKTPEDRPITELTAGEFKEVIQGEESEEAELEAELMAQFEEEEESEPEAEVAELSSEEKEALRSAWDHGVWEEMAEEILEEQQASDVISKHNGDTKIVKYSDRDRVRIQTDNTDLRYEILDNREADGIDIVENQKHGDVIAWVDPDKVL
ncbi:hypothetical protein [Halopenitus sp. POP-27]|uniref:hypothetical protein n=1 Tax=Halopenitus sp. POP-27 TaxID=2994425 RepID=UPI0024687FF4|nr:hypothetical protein [Halopenitus sp. POP-27]